MDWNIAIYWTGRAESAAACAERLALCLCQLGDIAPSWAQWYRPARSRKAALWAAGERTRTPQLLQASWRRHPDGTIDATAGTSIDLWNGEGSTLAISCGSTALEIPNLCSLTVSPDDQAAALFHDADHTAAAMDTATTRGIVLSISAVFYV